MSCHESFLSCSSFQFHIQLTLSYYFWNLGLKTLRYLIKLLVDEDHFENQYIDFLPLVLLSHQQYSAPLPHNDCGQKKLEENSVLLHQLQKQEFQDPLPHYKWKLLSQANEEALCYLNDHVCQTHLQVFLLNLH